MKLELSESIVLVAEIEPTRKCLVNHTRVFIVSIIFRKNIFTRYPLTYWSPYEIPEVLNHKIPG